MAPPPRSSMPLHFPRQGLSANHSDATQCTLSETIPKRKRRKKQNEKGVESADTVELNSRVRSSSRGDGVDQWLRCAAHYSEPAAAGSIPDGSSSSRLAPPLRVVRRVIGTEVTGRGSCATLPRAFSPPASGLSRFTPRRESISPFLTG